MRENTVQRLQNAEFQMKYIAICTGIQRDGGAIATTINRAKPSGKELQEIFRRHITENTLALTDEPRSYYTLERLTNITFAN